MTSWCGPRSERTSRWAPSSRSLPYSRAESGTLTKDRQQTPPHVRQRGSSSTGPSRSSARHLWRASMIASGERPSEPTTALPVRAVERRSRTRVRADRRAAGAPSARRCEREPHDEARAGARGGGHVDLRAERGAELLRDGEAEARPRRGAAGPAPVELVEDALRLVRHEPHARVAHRELEHVLAAEAAERAVDADLPALGELRRVREEVQQHLLEPAPVGHEHGVALRDLDLEPVAAPLGERRDHRRDLVHDLRDRDGLEAEGHLA